MLKIGVIADDFTGATDIASFLVENGMPTVQINDVPTGTQPEGCDAVVISLKTRSCPAQEAIKQSLAALVWLKKNRAASKSISNIARLSIVPPKAISARSPMR